MVAQAWDPRRLIVEFKSPVAVEEDGQPGATVNWTLGRASVFGLPEAPRRGSMEFSDFAVERIASTGLTPLFHAKKVELHGRLAEEATADRPVIDTVVRLTGSSLIGIPSGA